MNIFTDDSESTPLAYARTIEAGASLSFGDELIPNSLVVAKTLWTIRNRRRAIGDPAIINLPDEYSEGWGYHVSPELFLTLAALCDQEQRLLSILSASKKFTDIIAHVDEHAVLEDGGLFELGGSFLDRIVANPSIKRTHDAMFGEQHCITVHSPPVDRDNGSDTKLKLIFANALFEETSGIIRTLVEGPANNKELQPVFQSLGYGHKYYDGYRRNMSRIAAFELFAWCRNQLETGGLLVVNNVLSPAAVPDDQQLAFLGFASHPTLFARPMTGPGGDYRAAVHVFQAGLKRNVSERLTAVVEDYPRGWGRSQKRLRQRQWCWLDGKIVAKWI